jgi:hypothetical protein
MHHLTSLHACSARPRAVERTAAHWGSCSGRCASRSRIARSLTYWAKSFGAVGLGTDSQSLTSGSVVKSRGGSPPCGPQRKSRGPKGEPRLRNCCDFNVLLKSGRPDSNRRRRAWEADLRSPGCRTSVRASDSRHPGRASPSRSIRTENRTLWTPCGPQSTIADPEGERQGQDSSPVAWVSSHRVPSADWSSRVGPDVCRPPPHGIPRRERLTWAAV